MDRSTDVALKSLAAVYESYLLGKPLNQTGATASQIEIIQTFERFSIVTRSAVQISIESCGVITGNEAALLRMVKKRFRNRVKTVRNCAGGRDVRKVLSENQAYVKFMSPANRKKFDERNKIKVNV